MPGQPITPRSCTACGVLFTPTIRQVQTGGGQQCSQRCRNQARPRKTVCDECGGEIEKGKGGNGLCKVCYHRVYMAEYRIAHPELAEKDAARTREHPELGQRRTERVIQNRPLHRKNERKK